MMSSSNARPSSGRDRALAAIVVGAIALVPYLGLPAKPLIYDAPIAIVANSAVQSEPLSKIWTLDFWGFPPKAEASSRSYRPLVSLSFALEARTFGNSPALFHATDMALHAANAAMVVLLLGLLGFDRRWLVPVGALFAVHPVQSEAVASAVGRADLMAASCLLGALLLYMRAPSTKRPALGYVACVVLLGAAFLCKEYAVVFPFVLLAVTVARQWSGVSPKAVVRSEWVVCGAAFALLAGYLGLRWSLFGAFGGVPMLSAADHPLAGVSDVVRVSTGLSLIPLAARLLVLPYALNHHYRYGTLPVVDGPLEPAALLGLFLLAVLAAFVVYQWRRSRSPALVTGAALLFLPLAPSINLIGLSGVVFAERFLYLPVAGLMIFVAWGCDRFCVGRLRAVAVGTLAVVAVASCAATAWRVEDWSSEERLARSSIEHYPGGSEVWRHLGVALSLEQRNEEAAAALVESIELQPDHPQTWHRYAAVLDALGRREESVRAWRRTLELSPPEIGVLWRGAGLSEMRAGNLEIAAEDLSQAHARMPEDPTSLYYLVRVRLRSGDPQAAVDVLRNGGTAIANDPESLVPLLGQALLQLARVRLQQGRRGEAIDLAHEATQLELLPPEGHFLAGLVAYHAQDAEQAREWFATAFRRDPGLLTRKHDAAVQLERAGQVAEAAEQYREILVAQPAHAPTLFNLGRVLVLAGRADEAIEPLERGLALQQDDRAVALLRQARQQAEQRRAGPGPG